MVEQAPPAPEKANQFIAMKVGVHVHLLGTPHAGKIWPEIALKAAHANDLVRESLYEITLQLNVATAHTEVRLRPHSLLSLVKPDSRGVFPHHLCKAFHNASTMWLRPIMWFFANLSLG